MLIFFIHGVATRDVKYADSMKSAIREEFKRVGESLPHFYASFWGNALSDVTKMWNCISQDLQQVKQEAPQKSIENVFRYQQFREGLLSEFVGDMFTYLNPTRGVEIRNLLAQQLVSFINDHPQEDELCIISHSLGSVILWDVLFSERFEKGDPAFQIRSKLRGFDQGEEQKKVNLSTLITMGSPILFINTMLAVNPAQIHQFIKRSQNEVFQWFNILHASDIVAYPLKSSLNLEPLLHSNMKDIYIDTYVNSAEQAALLANQENVAMAIASAEAHTGYWKCQKTIQVILRQILPLHNLLRVAVDYLRNVPGMTPYEKIEFAVLEQVLDLLVFKDGSGRLIHITNPAKIHHVRVFNKDNSLFFAGYVGWMHIGGLEKAIASLKNNLY
jgi:hypothetical protein